MAKNGDFISPRLLIDVEEDDSAPTDPTEYCRQNQLNLSIHSAPSAETDYNHLQPLNHRSTFSNPGMARCIFVICLIQWLKR